MDHESDLCSEEFFLETEKLNDLRQARAAQGVDDTGD
jgi:hypothetical protein